MSTGPRYRFRRNLNAFKSSQLSVEENQRITVLEANPEKKKKTPLHGGQSHSLTAEPGKINKRKKPAMRKRKFTTNNLEKISTDISEGSSLDII